MAVRVPLLLRRLRPALAHFVHSLPLALPCPAVLTVQDLSFERDSVAHGPARDGDLPLRRPALGAPRARACSRSRSGRRTTSSSSTASRRRRSSSRRSPRTRTSSPAGTRGDYVLLAGSIEPRKNPLLAADAARGARAARSSSSGRNAIARSRPSCAHAARTCAASCRRTSSSGSTQEAAALLFPTRTRASACPSPRRWRAGRRSSRRPTPRCARSAATRSRTRSRASSRATLARVLADPEPWSRAGLERARALSWERTARTTADVYREVLA